MRHIFLAASTLALLAAPAFADEDDTRGTLTLSAQAELAVEPEFASLSGGVESRGDTAAAAVRANANAMDQVMSSLRRAGIAGNDLQTTRLSVTPEYEWIENRSQRRLTGYIARNTVTARIRELDETGDVIDAMVSAGANTIDSLTFGADDVAEAMDEARSNALERLLEKASLFASATGQELCGINHLREGQARTPVQPYDDLAFRAEASLMDSATPIAAGELSLSATVSAEFCIRPAD